MKRLYSEEDKIRIRRQNKRIILSQWIALGILIGSLIWMLNTISLAPLIPFVLSGLYLTLLLVVNGIEVKG